MIVCGIDEAGKGPVIGPMIVAGAEMREEDLPKLKEIGAKDSKLLSPKRREEIYRELTKIVKYKLIKISPREIDYYVKDNRMNEMEALKICEIINDLNPDKAIIDCPSPNKRAFKEFLISKIKNKKIKLIVEHKADYKYEIVGAASIIAKVTRDREVRKIERKFNIKIGSGYPSDPKTREFIKNNWNKELFSNIFRKSWQTWKRLKEQSKTKQLKLFGKGEWR